MANLLQPETPAPGLTSVMRAAKLETKDKALRVGVVEQGTMVDEILLRPGEDLTVGPNETSRIVIAPASGVSRKRTLVRWEHGSPVLCVWEGLIGRIASPDRTGPLAEQETHGVKRRSADGAWFELPLSDGARGNVRVGDKTLLFHVIFAPRPAKKAPPPLLPRNAAFPVDWRTTTIAAFSFLVHFGAIGSVYADWTDTVIDDQTEVAQFVEQLRQLPLPPPIERAEEANPKGPEAVASAAPKAASGAGSKSQGGQSGGASSGAKGMSDARAHAISSELARLDVAMLTALNSGGSATRSVLDAGGNIPSHMLDAAAASEQGANTGFALPSFAQGANGIPRPGTAARDGLSRIGDTRQIAPADAGSAAPVARPPGGTTSVAPPLVTGDVPNAQSVVAGMAPGFRRCYQRELSQGNPNAEGSVRFTVRVGPNGEVMSASPSGGGLPGSLISCAQARVLSAQFSPPSNGGATLVIPVSFRKQQ